MALKGSYIDLLLPSHVNRLYGLQMHGMPDGRLYTMRWRDIRLRELDAPRR